MDVPFQIKSLILRRRVAFTQKARDEMEQDGLNRYDVYESILNGHHVVVKRSTSPRRREARELLYIIEGRSFHGTLIYTKGTIRDIGGVEYFYVLISAKRSGKN